MLAAAVSDRTALIVVDDVWHPWQTRAFDVARGPTRLLFTTRFPEALPGDRPATQIARLGPREATAFLNGLPIGAPPAAENLAAVLDAAGGLRLALAVLAATASVEGSWAPVLSRLDGLAERFGHGDDASSAQKALFVALQTLTPEDRDLALISVRFPPTPPFRSSCWASCGGSPRKRQVSWPTASPRRTSPSVRGTRSPCTTTSTTFW